MDPALTSREPAGQVTAEHLRSSLSRGVAGHSLCERNGWIAAQLRNTGWPRCALPMAQSAGVRTVKLCRAQVSVANSPEIAANHPLQLVQALGPHDCALHDVAGVVVCIELPDFLVRLPALRLEVQQQ